VISTALSLIDTNEQCVTGTIEKRKGQEESGVLVLLIKRYNDLSMFVTPHTVQACFTKANNRR
jgi:hypothetical protein